MQDDGMTPTRASSTGLASTTSTEEIEATSAAEKVISQANWDLLSDRSRTALMKLIQYDLDHQHQTHVYENWPEAGVEDEGKRMLAEQVSQEKKTCVANMTIEMRIRLRK